MANDWDIILGKALAMEDEGREYYLGAAARVASPLAKRTFTALAADELVHKERILSIHGSLTGKTAAPWEGSPGPGTKAGPGIFSVAAAGLPAMKPDMGDLDALNHALDLEKASWELYHGLAEERGKRTAEFFRRLAEEEMAHFRLIEETITLLRQSWESYQGDEKPIFEGG